MSDSELDNKISKLSEEEIYDLFLHQLIEEARESFYIFVQLIAPDILPEQFVDGKHIEIICRELQKVEASVADPKQDPGRLQIFLPPGSMKSRLGNLFCAWCLGKHPNWFFLAVASDENFAIDNYGRPVKEIIDSPKYQTIFPETILKKDVAAAGRWDTTRKGRFVSKGVGGSLAGRRAHITLVDDVITEHTTLSDLPWINEWYLKGLRTRLLPRGGEVIINTRWYSNDLSGFLEKLDQNTTRPWKIIRVPALLTEDASRLLLDGQAGTLAYEPGTSFWPEFWPTATLLEKKAVTPPSIWSALYQQDPINEEGSIIKRGDFKIWEEPRPPECRYILVSMDTAFSTKETADYSAYTVWGVFRQTVTLFDGETQALLNCMILLEADRGRWDFAELCQIAQEIDKDHRPDYFIIEDKASGQSLIPELRKRGLPIMPYKPERDKLFRLQATTPYFQAGRIWVPKNKDYVNLLIDEVVSFPKAPNDDLTDTVSQAILWMRDTLQIDNDGYSNFMEEDDRKSWSGSKKTYWSSLYNS